MNIEQSEEHWSTAHLGRGRDAVGAAGVSGSRALREQGSFELRPGLAHQSACPMKTNTLGCRIVSDPTALPVPVNAWALPKENAL